MCTRHKLGKFGERAVNAEHNSMRVETVSVHAVPTEPFISRSGARAQNGLELGSKVPRANQEPTPIAAKAVVLGCCLGTKTQAGGRISARGLAMARVEDAKQVVVAQQGRWG
jgi:hypothetical protein